MATGADWLQPVTIQALAVLAATVPFVLAAARRAGRVLRDLLLLALFFWAALLLSQSSRAFSVLPAPWQGMLLEALFALAVIAVLRMGVEAGLTLRIDARAWRATLLATLLLVVFVAARSVGLAALGMSSGGGAPGWAFLLYQATMPGIAEELVYRGVIQSRLNRLFGVRWNLFGARVGWGFVITAVLFWAVHAFRAEPGAGLSFYWPTLTLQLWAGLVFGWIRERTGSVIPAVVSHNILNVVWTVL